MPARRSHPADDLPDLHGKVVVITGASAGIGAAAARRLAAAGATVHAVGRDPGRTAAVAADLGTAPLVADFARLDDVRRLAADVLDRCPRLDVLVNNAGGVFPRHTTTVDGIELTFQVNHLAGYLLTALLRARLTATPGARVVTTSSAAHRMARLDPGDPVPRGPYRPMRAYAASKLANILFTRELALRLDATGTAAVAVHPGVVASDFGRDSTALGLLYRSPLRRVFLISPEDGAAPLVALATRGDVAAYDGVYFDRFRPNGPMSRQALDPWLAERLWERSAELTGVDP